MERYCEFCKKLYKFKKGIKSQAKFVIEMFNSSGLTYFSADYHEDYAKLLFNGKLGNEIKKITQTIRDTAPQKINITSIRDFFFKHLVDTKIDEIFSCFNITNPQKNFNVFLFALAEEFKYYCEQDEEFNAPSVKDLYEKYLNTPSFGTAKIINENNAAIEKLLLSESGDLCPICGKPLYTDERGKNKPNYSILPIFPIVRTEYETSKLLEIEKKIPDDFYSQSNLIAVCLSCSFEYDNLKDDEKIERYKYIKDRKKALQKKIEERRKLSNYKLNSRICSILDLIKDKKVNIINGNIIKNIEGRIVTLSDGSIIELNDEVTFTPATIKDKIKDDEDLIDQLNRIVLTYYQNIKAHLLLLDDEEIGFFDELKDQINDAYQVLKRSYIDKKVIILKLNHWLLRQLMPQDQADLYEYEGMIIIAFFIQNCEVFEV